MNKKPVTFKTFEDFYNNQYNGLVYYDKKYIKDLSFKEFNSLFYFVGEDINNKNLYYNDIVNNALKLVKNFKEIRLNKLKGVV